ncbi:unnamed protein product, partial [Rhizoctonia solani]
YGYGQAPGYPSVPPFPPPQSSSGHPSEQHPTGPYPQGPYPPGPYPAGPYPPGGSQYPGSPAQYPPQPYPGPSQPGYPYGGPWQQPPPIIIQPPAVITSPVPISSSGQTQGSQSQPPVIHVSPSPQGSQGSGPQIIRVEPPPQSSGEPQIIRIGSPGHTATTPSVERIVVAPTASSSGRSEYYPYHGGSHLGGSHLGGSHLGGSHLGGSRIGTPRMRVPDSRSLSPPVMVDLPHRPAMSGTGTERYYPSSSSQSGTPGVVFVEPHGGSGQPIPYARVGEPARSRSRSPSPTHVIVDADGRRYRKGARSPPHLVQVVRDSPSRRVRSPQHVTIPGGRVHSPRSRSTSRSPPPVVQLPPPEQSSRSHSVEEHDRPQGHSHAPPHVIRTGPEYGRPRSPTQIVIEGSSREGASPPTRVIRVEGSSETRSQTSTRIIRVDDDRSRHSDSPRRYPHETHEIHVVGSGSRPRTPSRSPTRIIYDHSRYGSPSPSRVHTPGSRSRSPTQIIRVGSPDRYGRGSAYGGSHYPGSHVSGRPTVIRVGSAGPVHHGPDLVRVTSPRAEQPQVVRVGGTPSQTPTPQVIRVTTPQVQVPHVIHIGSPQTEEPPRIIRFGVPRTSLPSYLPERREQPDEPTQRQLSQITEETSISGSSEIPAVIEIPESQQQRPPVQRTASGRTEPPPPHVIRVGAGSRAGRSEVPLHQIRVTTPGPIEYPPPQVIHIGSEPSEDYPPPIVRVSSTKPAPQPEAPPTIVRLPSAQGKSEYQPHVIRVASPPVAAPPSVPHVVRLGTTPHVQEEPQMIRVKSPPQPIYDPVPQVVHLKSAPQSEIGPQIIRVATAAIPQRYSTPAQVFRIGTPGYPEPPQIVRVGTAKLPVEDKLEQIIHIGVPTYPEPPQTPQVIRVGVQPQKEVVSEPQVVRIGTQAGVSPTPQVIRVAAPPKEAPTPVDVIRIGSPTITAPIEPQVIRVTSPPAQVQQPTRVVRVGSAVPKDVVPQVIRVKSPERPPLPTEIIRVGSTAPTVSEGPQVIRVGTSRPPPVQPTQIIRTGTAPPSEPQLIRVTSPPQQYPPTEIVRVGSAPPASEGPQVIRVGTSHPPPEPTQIIRTGTAPPTDPQVIRVTSPPSKTEIIRLPAEFAPTNEGPQVVRVTSSPSRTEIIRVPGEPVAESGPQVIRVTSPPVKTEIVRLPAESTSASEERPLNRTKLSEYLHHKLRAREEEATPIAVAIPVRPKSEVSSLDLTESLASLTEASPTIGTMTISDESSLSGSMLSDSSITASPTASVSEISGISGGSVAFSIPSAHIPISVHVPISPSVTSVATPELTPPSSRSSPSRDAVGLTPSPSVQLDVLPEVSVKSTSPSLSSSPSIRSVSSFPKETPSYPALTSSKSPSIITASETPEFTETAEQLETTEQSETEERSETPVPVLIPVQRPRSLSPPPMRAISPGRSESDYFISSPLTQESFLSSPRPSTYSPPMSEVSIVSHGTVRPDSKSTIGLDELRGLLRDLLKQQDEVNDKQESQRAILEELRSRPPPTVVYQAPEISELVEHRTALTKIEHILGDLVERFEVVRDSFSTATLTQSSTLTSSSDTISSTTPSRPVTFYSEDSSEEERRRLQEQWDRVSRKPETQVTHTRPSPLPSLAGGLPPSEVTESEISVPPPTATTQLPLIPPFRHRMRSRRARSASPSITFERIISSAESSSPSSSSISYSRVREEVSETIIPKFGKRIPQAPELPEPSRTSVEELGQDINFEEKIREIRKRKEPSGDGIYIPSMPQPPAQPVLPDWATERDEAATPRPPAPPSDLGQGPSRRSPISDSWYTRPRPAPTEEQATEVGWVPELGTTIVPPTQVLGEPQQPSLHPHTDQIVPIEEVLGRPPTQPPTGPEGLPDYDELLDMVRGNSSSQDVVADQQREIIRYLGGLNQWLERDVIDRQYELRALSERMDQLRDELLYRLGRPPTPTQRPPFGPQVTGPQITGPKIFGPQIVGQVPPGGIVMQPLPDRGPSRGPSRVSHRSYVVPGELSESVHGPHIRPIYSSSEETHSTHTSDEQSFQIPGHPPVRGVSPTSGPVIPSHMGTSSSESISTSAASTFESGSVTGEESGPEVYPVVPGESRPPSSYIDDGAIVIPLDPSRRAPSAAAPSVYAPSATAPSVYAPSAAGPSVYAPSAHSPSVVASPPRVPGSVASPRIPGSVASPRIPGSVTSPARVPGSASHVSSPPRVPSYVISPPPVVPSHPHSSAPHSVASPQAGVIVVQPPVHEEIIVVEPAASEAPSSESEPAIVEIVQPEVPPVDDTVEQVIRVSSPAGSHPPAQVIRIGSPISEAPQVIRIGSPAAQAPQIIRIGSPSATTATPQAPQVIRIGTPAASQPGAQVIRIGTPRAQPPQRIRVTSPPQPAPQIIRMASTPPHVVRLGSPESTFNPQILRVRSPLTSKGPKVIRLGSTQPHEDDSRDSSFESLSSF